MPHTFSFRLSPQSKPKQIVFHPDDIFILRQNSYHFGHGKLGEGDLFCSVSYCENSLNGLYSVETIYQIIQDKVPINAYLTNPFPDNSNNGLHKITPIFCCTVSDLPPANQLIIYSPKTNINFYQILKDQALYRSKNINGITLLDTDTHPICRLGIGTRILLTVIPKSLSSVPLTNNNVVSLIKNPLESDFFSKSFDSTISLGNQTKPHFYKKVNAFDSAFPILYVSTPSNFYICKIPLSHPIIVYCIQINVPSGHCLCSVHFAEKNGILKDTMLSLEPLFVNSNQSFPILKKVLLTVDPFFISIVEALLDQLFGFHHHFLLIPKQGLSLEIFLTNPSTVKLCNQIYDSLLSNKISSTNLDEKRFLNSKWPTLSQNSEYFNTTLFSKTNFDEFEAKIYFFPLNDSEKNVSNNVNSFGKSNWYLIARDTIVQPKAVKQVLFPTPTPKWWFTCHPIRYQVKKIQLKCIEFMKNSEFLGPIVLKVESGFAVGSWLKYLCSSLETPIQCNLIDIDHFLCPSQLSMFLASGITPSTQQDSSPALLEVISRAFDEILHYYPPQSYSESETLSPSYINVFMNCSSTLDILGFDRFSQLVKNHQRKCILCIPPDSKLIALDSAGFHSLPSFNLGFLSHCLFPSFQHHYQINNNIYAKSLYTQYGPMYFERLNHSLKFDPPKERDDAHIEKQFSSLGGLNKLISTVISKVRQIQSISQTKHSFIQCISKPVPIVPQNDGILLWGPPGNGKTLLARLLASATNCSFHPVKGPQLLSKYVGESEENVRNLFTNARKSSPSILFFDEIDSLAPKRSSGSDSHGVMNRVISQLLTEMAGLANNQGLLIIGATNRPDLLDPSLIRPGRFSKMYYVGPPDTLEAKCSVLKAQTTRKCFQLSETDYKFIANQIPSGCSGADISGLVQNASQFAFEKYIDNKQVGRQIESKATSSEKDPHQDSYHISTQKSSYPVDCANGLKHCIDHFRSLKSPAQSGDSSVMIKSSVPNGNKTNSIVGLHNFSTKSRRSIDDMENISVDIIIEKKHFLLALKDLVPSINEKQMAHYNVLKNQFGEKQVNALTNNQNMIQ